MASGGLRSPERQFPITSDIRSTAAEFDRLISDSNDLRPYVGSDDDGLAVELRSLHDVETSMRRDLERARLRVTTSVSSFESSSVGSSTVDRRSHHRIIPPWESDEDKEEDNGDNIVMYPESSYVGRNVVVLGVENVKNSLMVPSVRISKKTTNVLSSVSRDGNSGTNVKSSYVDHKTFNVESVHENDQVSVSPLTIPSEKIPKKITDVLASISHHGNGDNDLKLSCCVDNKVFDVESSINKDNQRVASPRTTLPSELIHRPEKPTSILRSAPPPPPPYPAKPSKRSIRSVRKTKKTAVDDERLNNMLRPFRSRKDTPPSPPRSKTNGPKKSLVSVDPGYDDHHSPYDNVSLSTTWSSDNSIEDEYNHFQDQRTLLSKTWNDNNNTSNSRHHLRRKQRKSRPPYWKINAIMGVVAESSPIPPYDRTVAAARKKKRTVAREQFHNAEDQQRADSNARASLRLRKPNEKRRDGIVGAIVLCFDRMRRRTGADSFSLTKLLARLAFGSVEYETVPFFRSSTTTTERQSYKRTWQGGVSVCFASALLVAASYGYVPGNVFALLCSTLPPIVTFGEIKFPHQTDETSIALSILSLRFCIDYYWFVSGRR